MFVVYKITNLINQKVYIGSSIRVWKRWKQHINSAFNPNNECYNYPLYQAFRKYGVDNFKFEILSSDYNSIEEMQLAENAYIKLYDSVNYGYNQTYCTNSNNICSENSQKHISLISQPCAMVNKKEEIIQTFPSYQAASRELKLPNQASGIRKVCKGLLSSYNGMIFRDLDENNQVIHQDIKPYKSRKALIGISLVDEPDIYGESILQISQRYGFNRQSIGKCLQGDQRYTNVGGYVWREIVDGEIKEINPTVEQVIDKYNNSNPEINGVRHSISEWCKIYNISYQSVHKRVNNGMSIVEAITKPKRR